MGFHHRYEKFMQMRISLKKAFSPFVPKSWICFQEGYSFKIFQGDLLAGITVGVLALPSTMAFAIASGLDPQRGVFTSIVAGFVISLFGGSRIQISGTAGAFVGVIYDVVQRQGYEGLVFATLIASLLLILTGIGRLGNLIKFIPSPLITGFTAGIAVTIFSSQIKDFLGLHMGRVPVDFFSQWKEYVLHAATWDPVTTAVAVGTLLSILLIRRFFPVVPWAMGSILIATFCTWFFSLPVPTIASKFGQIPHQLPLPSLPAFSFDLHALRHLFPDALTIAFLAGSKSLLSAVVADGMSGRRHNSNCELVALGLGNIGSVLFGGMPATGAIARTATSIKSGGKTPVAGIIHSLVLFFMIFFAAPLMSRIPLPALSAILVVIAYNMSEKEKFRHLFKAPKGDVAILLTAFFLTVFVDITVAVEVGMVLAAFFFMKRMSDLSKAVLLTPFFLEKEEKYLEQDSDAIHNKILPKGVEVYEMNGPFFFGAANCLNHILTEREASPKVFILRMRQVNEIDATGMDALKEFYFKCKKRRTELLLSGMQTECLKKLDRFGLLKEIGAQNIHPHIDAALASARQFVKPV